MKNLTYKITFFLLLVANFISSQPDASYITPFFSSVAFLQDTSVVLGSVDNISGKQKYSIRKNYGSGFFVNDGVSVYLITAQHVAKYINFDSDVVIRGRIDTPIVFKLKDIVLNKVQLSWVSHGEADVSVILLDVNSIIIKYIDPVDIEHLDVNRIPPREQSVITVGFPLELGFKRHFAPITKITKPVSSFIELARFDNGIVCDFILLDDPSISGFSGAPVFQLPSELFLSTLPIMPYTPYLIGLVHGFIGDVNGGFSAIVPSKYILDLLAKAPKFSGSAKFYHENGNIWSEKVYKDGVLLSVLYNFDKDGQPLDKGNFIDGNGEVNYYNEEGKLVYVETYLNGFLIKGEQRK